MPGERRFFAARRARATFAVPVACLRARSPQLRSRPVRGRMPPLFFSRRARRAWRESTRSVSADDRRAV
ncbi:hypothetical protein BURPS305_7341 [Burkholderia pseudomallei 305]|nr:hypothetical protein BURPS305_7341 [Burkholderia pseudomallei 305]